MNVHIRLLSYIIMISSKKLFKMAWNRQNSAFIRRTTGNQVSDSCSSASSLLAHKGHFAVYTSDRKRFLIPLVYLNKNIFRQLLKLSEEEFGLQVDGPITLPCDASLMEYIVLLIERGAAKNLENDMLIISVATSCCSSLSHFHNQEQTNQHVAFRDF
ncbi:hypothetical protein JRO89_XS02G0014600 [Xanthoceras sorbifolium]|uniref:Uncharacterized protein n=1 Tax=Xanthoceras sorbifolium TaxID=99658 RepID=A0ABQ8IDW6_9ROSI|nr:hypothetical protein JRO89_XS02G0014600 [Xanthoceras sorbifolium]